MVSIEQGEGPLSVEIAVIGSGPGGASTACLLAEHGREVLLVEEGEHLPLSSCEPFSREEMVQKYRNGGITVSMGPSSIAYVEGRCVGGGSEINAGLYHRTPPEVLDEWRRTYDIASFGEQDLAPMFDLVEQDLSVSTLPHPASAASLKLQEGADRLGWHSMEVPRWFRYHTDARGGHQEIKQSMTETYLPRFLRAGGRLLTNSRIHRIRRRGGCWELSCVQSPPAGGAPVTQIRAQTLFVACGAIQTPALLRRSGIKRNIGDSLRMHASVKVVAEFPAPVNDELTGIPVHQVKEFAPRFSLGGSISKLPYLALAMTDHPRFLDRVRQRWTHMASYYGMVPGGRGSVRALPGFKDPLVRYRLEESDFRNLSDALRELCRLLLAAGAEALYPSVRGLPVIRNEDDLTRIPRPLPKSRSNLMTIHLMGSCPMGENRRLCAVDSFGRVHGEDRLYIADASLLGGAPGVNPQGTIMALTRRNALQFLRKPD